MCKRRWSAHIRTHPQYVARTCACWHSNPLAARARSKPKKGGRHRCWEAYFSAFGETQQCGQCRWLRSHFGPPNCCGRRRVQLWWQQEMQRWSEPDQGAATSKRVHTNPRQRVVPFVGSLVGPVPRVAPAVASKGADFFVASHAPMDRDPPWICWRHRLWTNGGACFCAATAGAKEIQSENFSQPC